MSTAVSMPIYLWSLCKYSRVSIKSTLGQEFSWWLVRWIMSLSSPCWWREPLLNWWPQKDTGGRRWKSCTWSKPTSRVKVQRSVLSSGCKAPGVFTLTSGRFSTRSWFQVKTETLLSSQTQARLQWRLRLMWNRTVSNTCCHFFSQVCTPALTWLCEIHISPDMSSSSSGWTERAAKP